MKYVGLMIEIFILGCEVAAAPELKQWHTQAASVLSALTRRQRDGGPI